MVVVLGRHGTVGGWRSQEPEARATSGRAGTPRVCRWEDEGSWRGQGGSREASKGHRRRPNGSVGLARHFLKLVVLTWPLPAFVFTAPSSLSLSPHLGAHPKASLVSSQDPSLITSTKTFLQNKVVF